MTYWIVMGGIGVVSAVLAVVFVGFVLPADERKVAAQAALEDDARRAAARDAIWGATRDPDECPHDDVVEDWNPGRLRTWDESNFGAPQSSILDQGGRCRECGARVIRHGRPNAWTEWMIDPTQAAE